MIINVRVYQRHLRNHEQDDFEEIEASFVPNINTLVEFRGRIYKPIRVIKMGRKEPYYDLLSQKIRVLE